MTSTITTAGLRSDEAFAIIRAILCLYSDNKPTNMFTNENQHIIKKIFNLTDSQYHEINSKILEYSPKQITKSELELRYAWRDNHPIYKSKAFKDQNGHERWKNAELEDIKNLLKETNNINNNNNDNNKYYPTVQEIFGATLKKHTLNNGADEDKQVKNIHTGYKILVNAFIQYSMGESYNKDQNNNIAPMKPSLLNYTELVTLGLLPEFAWLLQEYCKLYGIRDLYRHLVIFEILSTRFDDNLGQLRLLFECFLKIEEIKRNHIENIITEDEENYLNTIATCLLDKLKSRLGNYRFCFSPKSKEKQLPQQQQQNDKHNSFGSTPLSITLNLINCIITHLEWSEININHLIITSVVDANEREYKVLKEYHESLHQLNLKGKDYQIIYTLAKIVAEICQKWISTEDDYFDPIFNLYLSNNNNNQNNNNNNNTSKRMHLELVIETISKYIKSELSIISQTYSKENHTIINPLNGNSETSPWITCLFIELLPNLIKFNTLVFNLTGKSKCIALDGEILFLAGKLVLNRAEMLNHSIKHLINNQKWELNGKGVLHTTSPVDLFSFINEVYKSIRDVEKSLEISNNLNPLTRSFGTYIEKTFLMYVRSIRHVFISTSLGNSKDKDKDIGAITMNMDNQSLSTTQLLELLSEIKSMQNAAPIGTINQLPLFLNEKMCYQCNDLEHCRSVLDDFDNERGNIFKESLDDVFKMLKNHWKLLLSFIVSRMNQYLKPTIEDIALSNTSCDKLINFIDNHLGIAFKNMYPNLFKKFMKYLLKQIVINISNILSSKTFQKKCNNISMVVDKLKDLIQNISSVFGSKEGLSNESIGNATRRVSKLVEIYQFPSEQLIQFYKVMKKIKSLAISPDTAAKSQSKDNDVSLDEIKRVLKYQRDIKNKEIIVFMDSKEYP
ncbi:hypothetical protein CYY_002871 [Polysphondylium violaceum]|uniref:MHD2 domain-containing protein n=1 Tax=Polysphondylium violaceum TaxID=133409 RepID=A0A8J4Q0L2_9MYCE|nr:hypothetical protein CYY_002871 [Polysphondylium violaceum]